VFTFIKNKMTTVDWLNQSLNICNDKESIICRLGRNWKPVAGFSKVGSIFCIYKDENNFCVHAGDEWNDNEEPLLGYYDINLTWDKLISQIAQKYDSMRSKSP
jgi:hypothetical protein